MELLTSKERLDLYFKGKEVDRVPVMPFLGESSSGLFNISPSEHNRSAELMANMEILSYKTFNHDGCSIGTGLRGMAEAMGSKVVYPKAGIPYIKEVLLEDYKDLDKIKTINPLKDGRLPIILDALQIATNAIGKDVDISCELAGPFTIAASVRGFENLIKDLIKNKRELHNFLEIVTENNLRFIDAVASLNLNINMGMCDPVASLTILSQKQFREFAMPYLQICANRIKEKTDDYGYIHICGKSKDIWMDLKHIGFSTLSIDNCEDISEAVKMVGDKMCIMGNIPPVDVIKLGSKEDVYSSVEQCIIKGKDSPSGYVLSSGCDIPPGTNVENIHAIMDASRIFYKKHYIEKQ